MKFKNVIYVLAIMFVAVYTYQRNSNQQNSFLLANIEALSNNNEGGGHDEIDETLVPYKQLSSIDVFLGNNLFPTKIPCCISHSSKYSGCAKGLTDC